MSNNYDWMSRRQKRSVDALKLWSDNPRLNPSKKFVKLRDYVEDIIAVKPERDSFLDVMKDIATQGWKPIDPIVVWQDHENKNYYVAEGNRRVMILKLLRSPHKSPPAIKAAVEKYSKIFDANSVEKISVAIAPSLEDARWYINQRHGLSSTQRRWSSVQNRRNIARLYNEMHENSQKVADELGMDVSEVNKEIRLTKLFDYIEDLDGYLSDAEFEEANSIYFPITTVDRFFSDNVREAWGVKYDGANVEIVKDKESFLNAYKELIRRMLLPVGDPQRLDSRNINKSNESHILSSLPVVEDAKEDSDINEVVIQEESPSNDEKKEEQKPPQPVNLLDDPKRKRLVPGIFQIETEKWRLMKIFWELKSVPFKYPNALSGLIRIFLDLAVLDYIQQRDELLQGILNHFNKDNLRHIELKKRLDYLAKYEFSDNPKVKTLITKLLNPSFEYSLDVLNAFQHNHDVHFLKQEYLNNFWSFLFPLVEKVCVITRS